MSEKNDLDLGAVKAEVLSGDAMAVSVPDNDEPTFEELIGVEDETEMPDGMAVLDALSDAEPEAASAANSYGYDKVLSENGKWFAWPKLGPNARVYLCMVGNKAWKALSDRARVRYGSDDGTIKPEAMDKIIEPMMAKCIFTRMDGVVVEVGEDPMADSLENRLRLMAMFSPGLRNDLFKAANNPRNFRDLSEEVLGN